MNERWLPYPGAPTQWFMQRWPQPANAARPAFLLEPVGTTPGTWSNSGTGLGVNAPTGFAGNLLDLQVNGTNQFKISNSGLITANAGNLTSTSSGGYNGFNAQNNGFTISHNGNITATFHSSVGLQIIGGPISFGTAFASNVGDTFLYRDGAANTLAQRNGTNAQSYRLYNTYTSSTSFERLNLAWSSNTLLIGTEKGSGGGTARSLEIQTDGTTRLAFDTIGSIRLVTALTVATLPASPTTGMVARVNNALSPTLGATVVGGGSANALCWYNGTNWTVIGI